MPDDPKRPATAAAAPAARPARRCPVCGRPAAPATRPFCSVRCRQVDLGRWLAGDYAVPGEPEEEPGEEEKPRR